MASAVRLRGEFWPQDHWGRVTNAAVPRERVQQAALEAAEEAADLALERFGERLHSVYLSGPAARGRSGGAAYFALLRLGASISTLDSREIDTRTNETWESAAAAQLRRRHPKIGRIAVAVFNWQDVFTTDNAFSPARFRLAVNSICIAGRNMSRMLAPQRLDSAVMNGDILGFRPRMLNIAGRLAAARSPDRVRAAAMDAGHAVLAASFALVMEREQIYTEDLDLRRDRLAPAGQLLWIDPHKSAEFWVRGTVAQQVRVKVSHQACSKRRQRVCSARVNLNVFGHDPRRAVWHQGRHVQPDHAGDEEYYSGHRVHQCAHLGRVCQRGAQVSLHVVAHAEQLFDVLWQ
jgi:hypothetical protein